MATKNIQDYNLSNTGYVAFDAVSLKDIIIERLNRNGVFTDQNYEGSNWSAFIDVVSVSYHYLIYYLNKNASETLFSKAQLYENINSIVKSLDYNPLGPQTSVLPFEVSANVNIIPGVYTIPRYSYFTFNGINYSFTSDITFAKTELGVQALTDFSNRNVLYEGKIQEYPIYTALGDPYETITLTTYDTINNVNPIIDNFNIFVYVKSVETNTWEEWTRTTSLYTEAGSSKRFAVRFNEDQRYEIKFGNNITGRKLTANDSVAIYYLRSDGTQGEVKAGSLDNNPLFYYTTPQFDVILQDVKLPLTNYLNINLTSDLTFTNTTASTPYGPPETVEEIRVNAPQVIRSQYRLVTKDDYKSFVNRNFKGFLHDVYVANNADYLNGQYAYLKNIGLNNSLEDSRVLQNQVLYGTSVNFNNIYIYTVPKQTPLNSTQARTNYLTSSQKQIILDEVNEVCTMTTNPMVFDPVYIAFNIGISPTQVYTVNEIVNDSYLQVIIDNNANRTKSSIAQEISNIIIDFFSISANVLGGTISLDKLSNLILSVSGVKYTNTNNGNISKSGLSFIYYNPIYPEGDKNISQQNIVLQPFMFPYYYDTTNLITKINVFYEKELA